MMKQTGKLTILMVAVVAIGIFALPSIMSAGAGQHQFINATSIRGSDSSKNCLKCHGTANDDVSGELGRSDKNDFYNTAGARIHILVQCADCHDLSRALEAGVTAYTHTKVPNRPDCMGCHNGATVQGVALDDVWTEIGNATEAHAGFKNASVAVKNAGCIGCHTHVAIAGEISYTYSGAYTAIGLTIGDNLGKPDPNP